MGVLDKIKEVFVEYDDSYVAEDYGEIRFVISNLKEEQKRLGQVELEYYKKLKDLTEDQYTKEQKEVLKSIEDYKGTLMKNLKFFNEKYGIDVNKKFNKYECLNNIRILLKDKNIKIGTLEKEAGCQPGYISRIEKLSNNTEPSIEILLCAAKLLDVSVDLLTNGKLADLTESEIYIIKFLEKLYIDIEKDETKWKKINLSDLNNDAIVDQIPLFIWKNATQTSDCDSGWYVNSHFYDEGDTFVVGNGYRLSMDYLNADLYILNVCNVTESDESYDLELYFVDKNTNDVHEVVSTHLVRDEIKESINRLYSLLEENQAHVKVDEKTKSFIDSYMNVGMPFDF